MVFESQTISICIELKGLSVNSPFILSISYIGYSNNDVV